MTSMSHLAGARPAVDSLEIRISSAFQSGNVVRLADRDFIATVNFGQSLQPI
jgi:hypothetical protein